MIYLGNNKIGNIYSGENKIDKIYKGEELVYSSAPPYVLATDEDFSGTRDGTWRYIGTDEYVIIPLKIKGITVKLCGLWWQTGYPATTYHSNGMFQSNRIIKGVATQEGAIITSMYNMFISSTVTEVDLRYFDLSNVTNMQSMFYKSNITTVYVKSEKDANILKASSNKPAGLTFVVKP